ncbi:mitochondrial fission regulator 1 isoform X3 [Syngnathus acus]|uniref:mitochondrial fission regulator 1 isoform X3 n=1 Tax=Syngnathus acus TaxID=161584 RepID=UPI0018860A51|nr:mitochondrial fission regulator 1 isoform X3 [Syngnathus acus]
MNKHYEHIEMDLTFGSAKPYGSSRSIVRRIASNLPLKPCPRVHFQLYPFDDDAGVLSMRKEHVVASLADVSWIDQEDDEDDDREQQEDNVRPCSRAPRGLAFRTRPPRPRRTRLVRRRSLPSLHQGPSDPQGPAAANDEAIQKISVLETELAKLRAQIAQIVLAQEKSAHTDASTGTSPWPPTPCGSGPPPPRPPPPPPPPLPPPGLQRTFSAIDLIKERRGKKTQGQTELKPHAELPSMLDVLKDMNKVKLRSVKSSRPVEKSDKLKEPLDAAALIAQALKRKFAHTYPQSPRNHKVDQIKHPTESSLFGQHMLRSTGKLKFV